MSKTYSSFFFHFPPHDSPPPPVPTRAHTYSPSSHTPFRSFLSLDDEATTAYSSRSREHRRPRHALPALDTRLDLHSRSPSSTSSRSSHADRPLPSPKPVPMATLPAVPASAPPTHTRYPRPPVYPARPTTSPAHHKARKCMQAQQHTRTHAAPRTAAQHPRLRTNYEEPRSPPSPPSPQSPRSPAAHPHRLAAPVRVKPRPRPVSMASASSTASTHHRVTNRTDALARLEGRVPRSATLPFGPAPITTHVPAQPPPPPPFVMHVASPSSSSPSPSPSPSPRLPQISPPPYSPSVAQSRIKSAAPVMATKSFMPFSDDAESDDESDADDEGVQRLGVRLGAGLRLGSDSEDDGEVKVRRGRKKSRRTTIASWYVGPEPAPKNFMDFGDVDVDVDVYDLDLVWKGYMKKSHG